MRVKDKTPNGKAMKRFEVDTQRRKLLSESKISMFCDPVKKKPAIKRYFCSQNRHLLCRLWIIVVGAFEASLTKLTHSQRLEHLSLNQACRPGMKGKCTRPSILQISLFLTSALVAQIWFIFRFKKKKKLLGEADGGDRQKDWISVCWAATSHQSCHRLFKL